MNVGLPATLIAAAVLALTGCGGSTTPASKASSNTPTTTATTAAPTSASTAAPSGPAGGAATASATKIQALVPSVVNVVTMTAKNDPNPIFGTPGSYVSAAVIYEKAVKCTTLVVACGAKLEVYKSATEATARTTYLLGMKKAAMIPGGEYDYVRGVEVLRVFGGVQPSLAENYRAAFGGQLAKLPKGTAPTHPAP